MVCRISCTGNDEDPAIVGHFSPVPVFGEVRFFGILKDTEQLGNYSSCRDDDNTPV